MLHVTTSTRTSLKGRLSAAVDLAKVDLMVVEMGFSLRATEATLACVGWTPELYGLIGNSVVV